MAIGGLITVLCGGCTAVFLGTSVWAIISSGVAGSQHVSGQSLVNAIGGLLAISSVVGGLPTALGIAIFLSGRQMKRGPKAPKKTDLDRTFS